MDLPQIETDAIARTGGIAPKGASLELDGIEQLRIFPLVLRVTVGQRVRAMQGNDDALFVTCIARQARVRERMDVAGAHRITRTISRLTFNLPCLRNAAAPELAQDGAPLDDAAGAMGDGFVPVGWQSQHWPWIAGAKRAILDGRFLPICFMPARSQPRL